MKVNPQKLPKRSHSSDSPNREAQQPRRTILTQSDLEGLYQDLFMSNNQSSDPAQNTELLRPKFLPEPPSQSGSELLVSEGKNPFADPKYSFNPPTVTDLLPGSEKSYPSRFPPDLPELSSSPSSGQSGALDFFRKTISPPSPSMEELLKPKMEKLDNMIKKKEQSGTLKKDINYQVSVDFEDITKTIAEKYGIYLGPDESIKAEIIGAIYDNTRTIFPSVYTKLADEKPLREKLLRALIEQLSIYVKNGYNEIFQSCLPASNLTEPNDTIKKWTNEVNSDVFFCSYAEKSREESKKTLSSYFQTEIKKELTKRNFKGDIDPTSSEIYQKAINLSPSIFSKTQPLRQLESFHQIATHIYNLIKELTPQDDPLQI